MKVTLRDDPLDVRLGLPPGDRPLGYQEMISDASTELAHPEASIVMADIRGSTKAIELGRYRDVNLVGAACIAAIRNVFDPKTVPYVFGGDGATFLVPREHLSQVIQLLVGVKTMAEENLGLQLRVESLQVGELKSHEVRYGFVPLGEKEVLPFFRGSGIAAAEKVMKARSGSDISVKKPLKTRLNPESIKGLSCRLLPFVAQRGQVISVYIEPQVQGSEWERVLKEIFKILGEDGALERLRPIGPANARRKWLVQSWMSEAFLMRRDSSLMQTMLSGIKILFESFVGWLLFAANIPNPFVGDPKTYTTAMFLQSDWIKMDGALRLVLDVTSQEEARLRILLGEQEYRGKILFGIHASETALMTCHLQSPEGQRHVHFIDGGDGGLTLAARRVKEKKHQKDLQKAA